MLGQANRRVFVALALLGSPAATYGLIMLVTDGTGMMRDQWGWLILVLPPVFTTVGGYWTKRTARQVVLASIASILMTVVLFALLIAIALSSNPHWSQ